MANDENGSRSQPSHRSQQRLLELTTDDDVVDGNFERAARTITETATAILEVQRVSVWLFEDDRQRLRCVDQYERSTDTHRAGTELEATEFPTYVDVLRSHRSFAVDEARDDPRTEELTDQYLIPNDIYSLLDATLHDEGEVIGVVCHEQTDSTREWTETERQLATEIADVVHRALRNHRSRRQRQQLEFRRSLLKAQQEAMPDGVAVIDSDGEFVSYNDRFCDLFDLSPNVLESATTDAAFESIRSQLADETSIEDVTDQLEAASGTTETAELRLRDGRVFEWYTTAVAGDDGPVFGRLWLVRDITDRRDRQRELELRHRAIEEAPIGITISDPSQADNPLIAVNEQFERLTGYDEAEIVGRNCRFLQGEATDSEPVQEIRTAIDEAQPVTVELRNYRRDGSRFWNRVSIAPVQDETGAVTNYVGFQQDVTERKEATRQLRVLHRILRHNLANQLSLIRGYAEEAASRADGEIREMAEAGIEEIDRLLATTDTHRDIVQLLSERPTPRRCKIDVVVEQAVETVHRAYPEAEITVDIDAAGQVRAVPMLEEGIEQVLRNAVAHSGTSTTQVEVTVTGDAETVAVQVADEGPGLPPEEAKILTGEQDVEPLNHGTGMGLWLVYWILTLSEGSIETDENDPTGTIVRLRLPRSEATP
ncbi:hypothetical protein HTG_18580 [Natrinema mahii]|nr:hypothetical protein HTG_18580 [Natrinema mahii]